MLPQQRQALILEQVREQGAVRVADLVRQLGVSDMTVRRDLEVLDEKGELVKVHGGATAVDDHTSYEPGFAAKSALQRPEKEAIAVSASAMVESDSAIGLSAGTTTYQIALRIGDVPGLTVVTNSIWVADALHRGGRDDQTVLLTGGSRTPSDALVGPFAVEALRSVHLDLVFLGVHGMDPRSGFTTPNLLEAETNQALVAAGRGLIVVADHTKWRAVGMRSIARLDQADVLITDDGLSAEARDTLGQQVGELIIADVTGSMGETA